MEIRVLGAYGGESPDCRTTGLLINRTLALDAGSLSRALTVGEQAAVRSIVLSHSHMDHTASLPFFVENVYGATEGPIHIFASTATLDALRRHLFNNATWPDFTRLPHDFEAFLMLHHLEPEVPVEIEGVELTPIEVSHPVPTFGFLLRGGAGSVLWSSDTGPTDRLWQVANETADLEALCIDTSFDNAMQRVADVSLHLTPATLERELRKLRRQVPILLHHLKPPYIEAIHREVRQLGRADLDFLEQGRSYDFS